MKLCEAKDCSGCFACANICPKKCITMEEGINGHLFPVCDEKQCVDCGLCEKICPAINPVEFNEPKHTYAAWNKNLEEQKLSSSGGAAALLANAVLDKDGVVYGAAFDEDWNVCHVRCATKEDVMRLRTSKYVHSWIGDIYSKAKDDLNSGKTVMFAGTPCQVAGLKSFLRKDYENLFLVDLVCHGVPSGKVYSEEIDRLADRKNLKWIYFRGIYGGTYGYGFTFDYGNRTETYPLRQSYYIRSFMDGVFFRESCYSCRYANTKRVGDITIGDFWGLGKEVPFENPEKRRVSLILVNTEKGDSLFNTIAPSLQYTEREYKEAVKGNPQLRQPIGKPEQYEKFKKLYPKLGYLKTMERCFPKMYFRMMLERLHILRKKV